MQLAEAQTRALFDTYGVCVSEACDRCGKILGHVRFTRYDEPGEWCSRLCRDGVEHKAGACQSCGASLKGKRRGSRFCSDTCRKRQSVQNRSNNAEMLIQNKQVTDAISGFGYVCSLDRRTARKSAAAPIEPGRQACVISPCR